MGSTTVAVAATALTLYLLEIPANLLTLAGLGMGIGILVQNGLVVVQRLSTQPDTRDGRAAAARKIAPAVFGSTLTTGVVLFPFLYLQGNARAAFVPFAAAFLFALAWSVLTALLVVPALGAGASTRHVVRPGSRRFYIRTLGLLLRWRGATLVTTALVMAVLTWGFVQKVPRSSFGGFGERRTTLSVGLSFPRGSDHETLDQSMQEFERLVVGRPEVETVRSEGYGSTQAGMQVLFTRAGGLTAVPLELQELLTQRAVLIGGASVNVQGNGPGFYSGGGSSTLSSFRIRVLGYSYDGVGRIAEDLKERLERIPRVREARITAGGFYSGERGYQVVIDPDRAALARYGVTAAALAGAIAREVRGPVGGQLLEIDGDEVPVTVKAAGARDRTLLELSSAIVPTATGTPARIGDLSRVDAREALSTVNREDQQYIRQLSYDFRGPAKLARRTHDAFMRTLSAPAGYGIVDITTGNGFENDGSDRGLWQTFAMGVVLVILAVALVFDSTWGASIVFLSLPLSLAGVAAAFWATGAAFTREAAVGVILVVGLAVNHAILLVDAALARRRAHREQGLDVRLDAGMVLRVSLDRSGMILFVTLASLASLAPLSLGTDAGSLFGAIALATAGGTVFGTLGALFVVPVMLVGRRVVRRGPGGMLPRLRSLLARKRWRFRVQG
jgi:HAE1 family hydrophobic/amphiphilic exporter-1